MKTQNTDHHHQSRWLVTGVNDASPFSLGLSHCTMGASFLAPVSSLECLQRGLPRPSACCPFSSGPHFSIDSRLKNRSASYICPRCAYKQSCALSGYLFWRSFGIEREKGGQVHGLGLLSLSLSVRQSRGRQAGSHRHRSAHSRATPTIKFLVCGGTLLRCKAPAGLLEAPTQNLDGLGRG